MDFTRFITFKKDYRSCGTCNHWVGAREANSKGVQCLPGISGYCSQRMQCQGNCRYRTAFTLADSNHDCENWFGMCLTA